MWQMLKMQDDVNSPPQEQQVSKSFAIPTYQIKSICQIVVMQVQNRKVVSPCKGWAALAAESLG